MRLHFFLAAALVPSLARAQTHIRSLPGFPLDRFGSAMVSAGHQNGDTYTDLLVSAPGRQLVYCISGNYLATGLGNSALWSVGALPGSGSGFGSALADVGNLTGDSANDYVIGDPGYRAVVGSSVINGAMHLVDGATHVVVATIYGYSNVALGRVIVSVGDQNGDGKAEIAATGQSLNTANASFVHVIQGSAFSGTKSIATVAHFSLNSNGANEYGETLASGFDLDGDGRHDLAIGSPRMFAGAGAVQIIRADTSVATLAAYLGGPSERMGSSISAAHDYNGDGVVDFVIGAPNWSNNTNHAISDGRAVVLSGAKLRSYTPPYELATYSLTQGGVASYRFGSAVRACADLNGDGVGDFLIGAPDYFSLPIGTPPKKGAVYVYSGASLTRIATIVGANHDRLGDSLLGALQSVNGDTFPEFVVAGSLADSAGTDSGVIKLYSLFPLAPASYCIGKINSLGCTPFMGWSGVASTSATSPFTLTCSNKLNQVSGLFFYSSHPNGVPFQGGTLCVHAPFKRSPVINSVGSANGTDCTGVLAWDFGARIQSGVDPALVAGAETFVQGWSRDSASASTTSLSNALRVTVNP